MTKNNNLDRLEYALELFELTQAKEKSPAQILKAGLLIMEFGDIPAKEMLVYLDAVR